MRKWLLLALLLLPMAVGAQTAPTLYWEHDGLNVTSFTCQIGSGAQQTLTTTQSGTTYSAPLSACGTLSDGENTITIRACNGSTCTPAAAITVVKL